jgi:phosphopantetheinyl transferase
MSVIPSTSCIQCCFEPNAKRSANFPLNELEVLYGITKDLHSRRQDLKNYLTGDEKLKVNRFRFDEDRDTYIACHGLLRSVISKKLNKSPSELIFFIDKNNKPGIIGNPYYFNVTHDRDAFAFVISKHFYAGIDIENTDRGVDFMSILHSCFGNREQKYILGRKADAQNRFFLLWTRKEALLKALGTGIVDDLTQIELFNKKNKIIKKSFNNSFCYSVYNEHFIYSKKILNYFISIAIPQKAKIVMNQITEVNIAEYI